LEPIGGGFMGYVIKFADINDCTELGTIHCESWKVAYKGIVPDSILENMSIVNSTKKFIDSISFGKEKNVIITKDNRVIGFMCLGKCRDTDLDDTFGEIWGIYLLPSYWREGAGTELVNWGISYLKSMGYRKISLWVLEENKNARMFYEKFGFYHDGTIKELNFGKVLNEYRYIKDDL